MQRIKISHTEKIGLDTRFVETQSGNVMSTREDTWRLWAGNQEHNRWFDKCEKEMYAGRQKLTGMHYVQLDKPVRAYEAFVQSSIGVKRVYVPEMLCDPDKCYA